ncbi:MAG: PEP/pyruvate-binding domain-containing protein [Myxococcota bacterium]|nr:PEP/pyruvate-binding domain-containing protein [Myxococcota bacterium]
MGGKAFRLARLLEQGLPVPSGFVVTVEALLRAVESAGLVLRCEAAARAEAAGDGDLARELGEGIARALRAVPLPDEVIDAVSLGQRELLQAPLLPGVPARAPSLLVARSSARGEDAEGRSHAGQYSSVPNLRGLDGLLDGIREVWASWYSERAVEYRLRAGGPGAPQSRAGLVGAATIPPMSVLVQRMVPARASGMLFTANPVTGSRQEMTVESGLGLGEALAQGLVHPDYFALRRFEDGRVKLRVRSIGPKARRAVPGSPGSGELEFQEVPAKLRERSSLRRRELKKLCRMGLEVEALLGMPVDLEWSVDARGRLFLLQARPITALRPRRRSLSRPLRERPVLWTQRFSGERWTEQATPLGWSIIQPVLHHFIEWPAASEGWLDGSSPTRLYRGRPYFNVTIFRHLAFRLPGTAPPQFLLEMFPADEQDELLREAPYLPNLGLVASIFSELVAEKRWERYRWNGMTNHAEWEAFRPEFERAVEALPLDFRDLSAGLQVVEQARGLVVDYMGIHLLSLLFAHLGYELLDKALRTWVGIEGEAIRSALVAETGTNETLRVNRALWDLAAIAGSTPELRSALEQQPPPSFEELTTLAGGRDFVQELDLFLDEFGHRSTASYEIFSTRWADDPGLVLRLIAGSFRSTADQHPARRAARREQDRERAERLVRKRMARTWRRRLVPWRQQIFGRLLDLTRSYMSLRENQRFAFDRLLLKTKRVFERLGAILERDGVLEAGEAIVLLTVDELSLLSRGGLDAADLRELVEERRAEFESNRSALHPDFLEGEEHLEASTVVGRGEVLQGLGISPGRVRGRVRVISGLEELGKIEPGDILVTRATDPGWTPLFLTVGGLVLELGSLLSHAAVVAREYALPGVVNVEAATRLLEEGMEVTVDGDRGQVIIHRAASDPVGQEWNVLDEQVNG